MSDIYISESVRVGNTLLYEKKGINAHDIYNHENDRH
jgi:hypothetical protein